jgi:hypothetical protein
LRRMMLHPPDLGSTGQKLIKVTAPSRWILTLAIAAGRRPSRADLDLCATDKLLDVIGTLADDRD